MSELLVGLFSSKTSSNNPTVSKTEVEPISEAQMAELELWGVRSGGAIKINRNNPNV